MRILKFGGSSVANGAQLQKVREIVERAFADGPIAVVCSAHKGVTDLLVETAHRAARGTYDPDRVIARQQEIALELGCDEAILAPLYEQLRDLLRGIHLVQEVSPRSMDFASSFGERMSVRSIAEFISSGELSARAYDAWEVGFITDSNYGAARPTPGFEQRVKAAFDAMESGVIPIITGFIGKNEAGQITTVGRNGSDLTASLLGAALNADEVQIWTDTDGVMTADPGLVNSAQNIPFMRFDEAAELAYFGSRVLHPSTLLPAIKSSIPVRVLNTNRPDHPGTVIHSEAPANERKTTSIAYKENQTVLTLRASQMLGEVGFLARVFDTLARYRAVIDVVSTSEVSLSLTANNAAPIRAALPELSKLGECEVHEGKTILVVVGQHLAKRAGVAATVLGAVAEAGVNVEMISYAADSISVQMVIDDGQIDAAVRVLHRVLFESEG